MFKKIFYIIFILTIGTSQVQAQDLNNQAIFTTYPTNTVNHNQWIIKDINPGQTQQESITVKNLTDQNIVINLAVKETKGDKKNTQIIEQQPFQNIGNWIKLEQNSITLIPQEIRKIPFSISTPFNTKPGEYQGTILASYTSNTESAFQINTRIGNRIYLNVTKNHELQSNTINLNISPIQIFLIIISSLGLVFGLMKSNKKISNKIKQ